VHLQPLDPLPGAVVERVVRGAHVRELGGGAVRRDHPGVQEGVPPGRALERGVGVPQAVGERVQAPAAVLRPQPAAAMSVVVPSTVVMPGLAPAASRLRRISPFELGCGRRPRNEALPGPGFIAKAATHSGVAPAMSPVPVANVSYAPLRTKPWCVTPEAVIRALGSAPRASRAFTRARRSSGFNRPPLPRAPPCLPPGSGRQSG